MGRNVGLYRPSLRRVGAAVSANLRECFTLTPDARGSAPPFFSRLQTATSLQYTLLTFICGYQFPISLQTATEHQYHPYYCYNSRKHAVQIIIEKLFYNVYLVVWLFDYKFIFFNTYIIALAFLSGAAEQGRVLRRNRQQARNNCGHILGLSTNRIAARRSSRPTLLLLRSGRFLPFATSILANSFKEDFLRHCNSSQCAQSLQLE